MASILIVGAGMGGLAAGIYGRKSGFETRIHEMHSRAGGQCAAWKRKGYTFDGCIHHLMGCSPASGIHKLWRELGAMPTEMVYPNECVSVADLHGKQFLDYYDLERLRAQLMALSPQDEPVIDDYIEGIRSFAKRDFMSDLFTGDLFGMLSHAPAFLGSLKWFKQTMSGFAGRFSDPFLKRAFPLLVYSSPDVPMFLHLMRHACGVKGDIAWPVGASLQFVDNIVSRYESLGGTVHYRRKVTKILTRGGRAVGVRLEDGSEEYADWVISNADGRKTLLEMLDGAYMDDRLRGYCAPPADETNWAVHVFLGVDRDLSAEPSSLILLLDQPVAIAGHTCDSLEMQIYGLDPAMAPPGKGTIKVELVSSYSYWEALAGDRAAYEAEKRRIADQVIGLLEGHFPGIGGQVESVDVPTLMTWERYMGGTHGFANTPAKKMDFLGSLFSNRDAFVPGLDRFLFAGVWATSMGALFANALSGKKAVRHICKKEGVRFRSADI